MIKRYPGTSSVWLLSALLMFASFWLDQPAGGHVGRLALFVAFVAMARTCALIASSAVHRLTQIVVYFVDDVPLDEDAPPLRHVALPSQEPRHRHEQPPLDESTGTADVRPIR